MDDNDNISISPYQGKNIQNNIGKNVLNSLEYILITSSLLGENILLLFDKKHLKNARKLFPDVTVYFPQEIEILHEINNIKLIKNVHAIKKKFKGWVDVKNCKIFKE